MNIKVLAGSCYLALAYWLASNYSSLHTLFFPTLGAFCFLIGSKDNSWKSQLNILTGAFVASALGCLFYYVSSGPWSMIAAALLTMWLIKRCGWNAPPIAAVTLIPFYVHEHIFWLEPLFVISAVGGLFLSFWIAEKLVYPLLSSWSAGERRTERWKKQVVQAGNETVRQSR